MQGQRPFVPPINAKWKSWWVCLSQTPELIKNLVDVMFLFVDKDRSGTISFNESKHIFKDFGFEDNSMNELKQCFQSFDNDRSGNLA